MKPFKHHAYAAGLSLTALAHTLFGTASVSAEPRSYASVTGLQVQTQSAPVKTQVLNLPKGRSAVVDLPVDASDVFVSNPAVADAVLRTPRRIFVLGVANGQSDAIFFDGMGRQILNLSIRVDAPTDGLADAVQRLFPGTHVEIQSVNGHVVLSGIAHDAGESDQIGRLAASFAGSPDNVLNLMTIAGKDQVTLKVRIVEVNRSSIKQLGLSSAITYNNGTKSYSFGRGNSYGANGGYQGGQGLCYAQDGTRTTNFTNSNTVNSGTNNSTGITNGTSSSITNGTSSSITNGTSSSLTNTHSDAVNWTGSIPTNVTLLDVNGNPVTVAGTSIATALGGNLGGGGLATSLANSITSGTSNAITSSTSDAITSGTSSASGTTANTALSSVASTIFKTVTGTSNNTCLEAFESVGLARTLAEPNLTAVSGEAAKFLAGGEFPVPTGEDDQGRVSISFKPFGVGLGFTPVVLSGGRISLKISTEVSELSNTGAFTVSGGVTVPALTVRRAETSVEMQSGSSLMIAGLLQSKFKESIASLPGMTSLPVLGALFRSRDFLNDETEMVVLVTPYIVDPTNPDAMQTPADNLQAAGDMSATFMGQLNKIVKPAAGADSAQATAEVPYQAPVGYVIE